MHQPTMTARAAAAAGDEAALRVLAVAFGVADDPVPDVPGWPASRQEDAPLVTATHGRRRPG